MTDRISGDSNDCSLTHVFAICLVPVGEIQLPIMFRTGTIADCTDNDDWSVSESAITESVASFLAARHVPADVMQFSVVLVSKHNTARPFFEDLRFGEQSTPFAIYEIVPSPELRGYFAGTDFLRFSSECKRLDMNCSAPVVQSFHSLASINLITLLSRQFTEQQQHCRWILPFLQTLHPLSVAVFSFDISYFTHQGNAISAIQMCCLLRRRALSECPESCHLC